jgi:hypothetical protein
MHRWLVLVALAAAVLACGVDTGSATGGKDAAQTAGAGLDPWLGQVTGATARYDLQAKDWHALPFPSDLRRAANGQLDLTGFPAARDGEISSLLQQYLDFGNAHQRGWGLAQTLYVQFDGPLAKNALRKPAETLQPDAYFLVNVDPSSPERGKLHPLESAVSGGKRGQHLETHLLMAQPVWGLPLRPLTAYAFVVRRGIKDAEGRPLGRPAALAQVLDAAMTGTAVPAGHEKLSASLQPLVALLQDKTLAVPWKDIAAATVFTTGDPTAELTQMAEWVRTKAVTKPAGNWVLQGATKSYTLYTATYEAPNFQTGNCPYGEVGSGGFAFKPTGEPIVQRTEQLRVSVAVPTNRALDSAAGLVPVAMYAHGTGGSYLSAENEGSGVGEPLTERGIAVVGIDQPLHGPRCVPEITGSTLDFKTFNFLNIAAGQSNFRQSALDTVFLGRLLREGKLNVPAEVAAGKQAVQFDPGQVQFIGHSQGGLSGALVAAIDSHQKAYTLSGAGAGLSQTILLRKEPVDIAATLDDVLGLDEGELSPFHPAVALVQLLADTTDPLAYAPRVFQRTNGEPLPHVLLTEGLKDAYTPALTAESLATSLGLEVLAPQLNASPAMELLDVPVRDSPVQANLTFGQTNVTAVLSQWSGNHYVIFEIAKARQMYADFMASVVELGDAIVDHP